LKSAGAPAAEIDEAKKMIILFDSLQLAHKVILNSFYGYVMRKGSRWYSMEMAGVTCLTGAHIIQMARQLVERIGRPLELDTDGIWCILPAAFPENFAFSLKGGKKLPVSYPCVMLNHLVHAKFTNHQYQELADPATFRYETHSENTIFFEVDGPYKAMILPTSKEEDKNLKKRYAVFNEDGTLAELKGFEVKRRGELKLIKIFQQQIFKFFLEGSNLTETYAAVAKVANRWLDVLYQHGANLPDEELIDLICENRSMSKVLEEYGAQKSTSITTAKRLAQFLGEQMTKDKGLNCKYIISSKPKSSPVTDRAIPVAIFAAEERVKKFYLRSWIREDPGDMDPRNIIDWGYYIERLGSVIQKLITIPAALQKVRNPVPRVAHPDWLQQRIRAKDDKFKQDRLTDHFSKKTLADITNRMALQVPDVEDIGATTSVVKPTTTSLNGALTPPAMKRKGLHQPEPRKEIPFVLLPAKMPPMSENYTDWLKYQKKKWKVQEQSRARRNHLFGEKEAAPSDAITGLLRNQAELLYTSTWQVLQVQPTGIAGEVQVFVLIGTKVHSMKILVPQQYFINFRFSNRPRIPIRGCTLEKVNHTLPNGREAPNLYKLSIPSNLSKNEKKKLRIIFRHRKVEGVYGRHVPPEVRTILELGTLCTFEESQSGVLGKGLEHGFDISTLRRIERRQPYLSQASALSYVSLYHVVWGERQFFAIIPTTNSHATIIVQTASREASTLPNVSKLYTELLARRRQDLPMDEGGEEKCFKYQEKIHFETLHVRTKKKAFDQVSEVVNRLRAQESKPLLFVVHSSHKQSLMKGTPALADFPVLHMQPDAADNNLPPLGWQSLIARRLVTHYLALDSWIAHLVDLARFGDVPLCNLERNDPRYLIDISFARHLQQHGVVLWWSPLPRPDHGGHEKDYILSAEEVSGMPSVNHPGAYSTVCIEFQVRNLAINTILTASLVNELEGSGCDTIEADNAEPPLDNDGEEDDISRAVRSAAVKYAAGDMSSFSAPKIQVLREMVKSWWAAACQGSAAADVEVQHLVRWG
jgi:DNA polymerase epsilon subunit 1